MKVTLTGVSHPNPDDLDVLLVSPAGDKVVLMSDACGSDDLSGVDLTFEAGAGSAIPTDGPCASGSYQPANHGTGDTFPGSAPPGPYTSSLSDSVRDNPNGTWSLYVIDDAGTAFGSLGGWRLEIDTHIVFPGSSDPLAVAGPALPYPSVLTVSGQSGIVRDANVSLSSIQAQGLKEVDVLLVSPAGHEVLLMSDACGNDSASRDFSFDAGAASPIPMTSPCPSGSYQPMNYDGDNAFDNPEEIDPIAPPYPDALADLNGNSPNGGWSLYVFDDGLSGGGAIAGWGLSLTTGPAAPVQFSALTYDASESGTATIAVTRPPPTGVPAADLGSGQVTFSTSPGSAAPGSDYTSVSQTVSFAAGETSKTVGVPILDDADAEGSETVDLALSGLSGDAALGSPAAAVLTIEPSDGGGSSPGGGQGGGAGIGSGDVFDVIGAVVAARWRVRGLRTTVRRLQARNVPAGAEVEMRCRGKKCPFRRRPARRARTSQARTMNLLKALGRRRNFRAGQRLEIRITSPGMTGKVVRYRMRRRKNPKATTLCLPPGARTPQRC